MLRVEVLDSERSLKQRVTGLEADLRVEHTKPFRFLTKNSTHKEDYPMRR